MTESKRPLHIVKRTDSRIKRQQSLSGFALLELLLVMAITFTLSAIAVFAYTSAFTIA